MTEMTILHQLDKLQNTAQNKRQPVLSLRLLAVAEMIRPCNRLYDIGSDHAMLPIHLVRRGICRLATASDIGPGPVAVANRNIKRAGLQDQIETKVAFGLDGHPVESDDAIVMAGLGGLEMIDILGQEPRTCQQIILQPQKSAPELRRWLADHRYRIDDEKLVLDRNRLYSIISVRYETDPEQKVELSQTQAVIGPILLQKRPPLFAGYLDQLAGHLKKAIRSNPDLAEVLAMIEDLQKEEQLKQEGIVDG